MFIMSKLSKCLQSITAPFVKLFIKAGDKVIDKYCGKVMPKDKKASRKDFSKRLTHNLDTIIEEMWVPDDKLEELIGCQVINQDLTVPTDLPYEDLVYCYQKYKQYVAAVMSFSSAYYEQFHHITEAYMHNMDCDLPGSQKEKQVIDYEILEVSYIRKMWAKSLEEAEADISDIPATREEIIERLNSGLHAPRTMLQIYFIRLYGLMVYMRIDFRGDKKPLYNLFNK
jgi:hypothetical protein